MIDLSQQDWLQDLRLARLFEVIAQAGGEVRVAGGAVRNGLWGMPVKDIDVATTLLPQEVIRAGKNAGFHVHPTGVDHGTVTAVIDGLPMEVTTLRADKETDGRRAVVAFTKDWGVDARRRDFTFNALYCDLSGKIFDETGQGLEDCEARRVRFVGDASQRICEDYLRILRYFRFEAQYGKGTFDQAALAACEALKGGMKELSVERIQSELLKILAGPRAVSVIDMMLVKNILQEVLKVEGSAYGLARMIALEDQLGGKVDDIKRLAMLTSDVSYLRLSKAQQQRFVLLKAPVDISPQSEGLARKKVLYELGELAYRDAVMMAWVAGLNDVEDAGWLKLYALPDEWLVPVFPLTGKDMIAVGFPSGIGLGEVLKSIEQQWIAGGFSDNKQELLSKVENYNR